MGWCAIATSCQYILLYRNNDIIWTAFLNVFSNSLEPTIYKLCNICASELICDFSYQNEIFSDYSFLSLFSYTSKISIDISKCIYNNVDKCHIKKRNCKR